MVKVHCNDMDVGGICLANRFIVLKKKLFVKLNIQLCCTLCEYDHVNDFFFY